MNARSAAFWTLLLVLLVGVVPSGRAVAPQIDYQPRSQTNILYQQVAFGVIASGTGPLSYQWRKDGTPIPGATNDQLVLTQPKFLDAGNYSVVVANAEASVTSSNASLTLNGPKGGDLDGSFVNGGFIDGPVQSVVVQPDGKVVIGGQFRTVNGASRGGVARLNPNGTTDFTFMNGLSGANGVINALALQSDGKLLLGGGFTLVNGVGRTNVARLNPNGTLDTTFQNGLSGATGSASADPASVNSIAQLGNGKILIAGLFTNVNGISRNNIAQLNADGTVDTTFQNPLPAQGYLRSVAVQSDSKLLIGGLFAVVNGMQRTNIARLNADGSPDTAFQDGLPGVNGAVLCISVQTDDKVLVGGTFSTVNGVSSTNIARLNADGTFDSGFQSGLSGPDGVHAALAQPDGKILIGGSFLTVNGMTRNRIARLNSDGTLDEEFQAGVSGANDFVYALALESDHVLIGGNFAMVNGVAVCRVARLLSDGALEEDFQNSVSGPSGTVRTIALQSDGKVLIAGFFKAVDNVPRTNVARLNIDGSLDRTFQNGLSGINGAVYAMKAQPDGKVIVGGSFTAVNGVSRTNIARLNFDGSLDTTFQNDLPGSFGAVYSAALDTNGTIIIGGTFSKVNGITRRWIARLNPDGTLDENFLPGFDGNGGGPYGVACIALQPDGKILIGGDYSLIATGGGAPRNGIARLNPDGSLDTNFQASLLYGNTVHAMAVQSDGKILIGGLFMFVNGIQRPYMARLNSNGTVDSGFGVGVLRANGTIYSIAIQNDAKIIVGGSFTPVTPPSPTRIARLQANGSALDGTFQNGLPGANLTVYSIALQNDGRILAGGDFRTMNGLPVSGIARLWPSADIPPFITSISRTGENVSLTWEAIPNRTYRAQYTELLSPTNWISLGGDVPASASGVGTKTDSSVGGANRRFYRVVLLP